MPVYSSPGVPVEARESLASLSEWLAGLPAAAKTTRIVLNIPDLAALAGAEDVAGDPRALLVNATFQAQPFHEQLTGKNYVRNRWFDPNTGTWLTPDPLGYQDSSNLYAFCGGDPVNCSDPTGLRAMTEEDKQRLGMLKARGKKLFGDFMSGGRATFRQPLRVAVENRWWDPTGPIGGDSETRMVDVTVTGAGDYELAKRTMVNDVKTFEDAVARADADGEILYVPGQGFTTINADDRSRAETTTWIAAGIFFATDTAPLALFPVGAAKIQLEPVEPFREVARYNLNSRNETVRAEGTITGPHAGRGKGYAQKPVGGVSPGDQRGHLIPEGSVEFPSAVNIRENIISEAAGSNLGPKKVLDNLAARIARQNPESNVKFIAIPKRMSASARPDAVTYYITVDGRVVHAETILNR